MLSKEFVYLDSIKMMDVHGIGQHLNDTSIICLFITHFTQIKSFQMFSKNKDLILGKTTKGKKTVAKLFKIVSYISN